MEPVPWCICLKKNEYASQRTCSYALLLMGSYASTGPAEIIERKVGPDGSINYYVHYMDCESPLPPCFTDTWKGRLPLRDLPGSRESMLWNAFIACL